MIDLSTLEARRALGAKYAAKYGLDTALVCAICEQESSWNSYAIRYEPAFWATYVRPHFGEHITAESMCRASSFGLCQVMGQVARELGFNNPFLTELCDPDTGVDYGCKKLAQCLAKHDSLAAGVAAYNGTGEAAQQYAQQVINRMAKYQ